MWAVVSRRREFLLAFLYSPLNSRSPPYLMPGGWRETCALWSPTRQAITLCFTPTQSSSQADSGCIRHAVRTPRVSPIVHTRHYMDGQVPHEMSSVLDKHQKRVYNWHAAT